MVGARDTACRLAVVPSETDRGCYAWVIRAPDGALLARSPYAFATRAGARLSGECWKREMTGESATT